MYVIVHYLRSATIYTTKSTLYATKVKIKKAKFYNLWITLNNPKLLDYIAHFTQSTSKMKTKKLRKLSCVVLGFAISQRVLDLPGFFILYKKI